MRIALAVFIALHGIAHLPGFLVPWRIIQSPDLPYTTTILNGRVDVGAAGIRTLGVLWLASGAAMLASAAAAAFGNRYWEVWVIGATALSMSLSITHWPQARIGVLVNAGILLGVAFVHLLTTPEPR